MGNNNKSSLEIDEKSDKYEKTMTKMRKVIKRVTLLGGISLIIYVVAVFLLVLYMGDDFVRLWLGN